MSGRLSLAGLSLADLNRPPVMPSEQVMASRRARGRPPCSLAEFVVEAWPILNPATPLIWNWHLTAVADHIQAHLECGRFGREWAQNLTIQVPPGSSKSTIASVCATAWRWTFEPNWRVVWFSGNQRVMSRDSVACRLVIESDWYRKTFRPTWKLSPDSNEKLRFENTARGFRQANGMGTHITGDRPDSVGIDDALDAQEAPSEVKRDGCILSYDTGIGGRLADIRTGTRMIIGQRLHEDDLPGHVLAKGDFRHLKIEQERELQQSCECADCKRGQTFLGFKDPRTVEGELMDPVRFPAAALAQEKRRLGADYDGQHQQRPVPSGGVMFDTSKIEILPAMPTNIKRAGRGWDLAASELGAWTPGVKIVHTADDRWGIVDVVRFRAGPGEVERRMLDIAKNVDGKLVPIVGPKDPGQAGVSQAAALTKMLAGFMAYFMPQTGDKVVRATPFARQVAVGNVFMVQADWNDDYIAELKSFPRGKYKDQVDATSEIFNWMNGSGSGIEKARALLEMRMR